MTFWLWDLEDFKEFTSNVRIRNMQRAGFLCIYIPDIAVTPEQEA